MNKLFDFYFEKPFITRIEGENNTFYFFDYDERAAAINMEFQHLHPFYEIMLYLGQQKAIHYINGIPYEIKAGDLILLRPGLLHMSEYPAGEPSDRVIIQFCLPDHSQGMITFHQRLLSVFDLSCPVYRFADPFRRQIVSQLNHLFTYLHTDECAQGDFGHYVLYHHLIDFLYTLCSLQNENIYRPQKISDALTQKIYDINTYILSHYHENLTLEGLSKQFFISPYYLSHQFKNINQFTLSQYIQMTRVRNAQFLLLSSDLSISDIAQQCGFQSFSQFNRIFRRYSNCSPRDYQKHFDTKILKQNKALC